MKPQDIGFIFVLIALLLIKKPRLFLYTALASWIVAIPLFAAWTFFTAERLTWYGAAFILLYLLIQ
jgi:hypothetical protein